MTAETEAANVLDDIDAIRSRDVSNLLDRISALPEQCEDAYALARAFDWPDHAASARAFVVLGMGGSAIAGDILRSVAAPTSDKVVLTVRGYDVPAFVGADTLVVACSHSGNTEETLAALDGALERGARAIAITTGGALARLANERGLASFRYQYDGQPRCALGHQLMALVVLGERAGILPDQEAAVTDMLTIMREQRKSFTASVRSETNSAKQLAHRLVGKLPVIIGSGVLADAAHRWKTQINENSKAWAFWEELPEMDHNSVVGFGLPSTLATQLSALFLMAQNAPQREEVRFQATAAELARAGVTYERIDVAGEYTLSRSLSAIYTGDFVSYYLALLNGVDPTPVDPITRVKDRLAKG